MRQGYVSFLRTRPDDRDFFEVKRRGTFLFSPPFWESDTLFPPPGVYPMTLLILTLFWVLSRACKMSLPLLGEALD